MPVHRWWWPGQRERRGCEIKLWKNGPSAKRMELDFVWYSRRASSSISPCVSVWAVGRRWVKHGAVDFIHSVRSSSAGNVDGKERSTAKYSQRVLETISYSTEWHPQMYVKRTTDSTTYTYIYTKNKSTDQVTLQVKWINYSPRVKLHFFEPANMMSRLLFVWLLL